MINLVSDKPHYENVPFEIPDSWEWVTLGEISNYGQTKHAGVDKINNIDWVLELEDIEKDSAQLVQKLNRKERNISGVRSQFEKGQILYSKLRTYLNKVLVAPSNGYCTTEIIPFSCFGSINNHYITQVLRSKYFIDYTILCCYGCKMPRLGTDDAKKGLIPLPPINEQKRIVSTIEKWFELIDKLENSKKELQEAVKQVKSKVLELAIHGKLVPQDPNDEPAIELLKRINPNFKPCDTSHYENVPAGWSVVQLCDIAKTVTGSTPSKNNKSYYGGTFPLYKPSDLDAGRNVNEASEYLSDEGKRISRIIPANSIAICCIGSIGKCGYIMREGTTNQQINTIIPLYNIYPLYIYYFCLSASFVQQLLEKSSAVTIAIVNKSKLDSTFILLPPLAEQKRIAEQIETIFASLDTITAEL